MSGQNNHAAARLASAVLNIVKGAAAGGVHGAVAGAAKSFLPEIMKAAAIIAAASLLLPMLIFAALPNILFGYDSASATDIVDWTKKAYSVDAAYKDVEEYTLEEIDKLVKEISESYDSGDYDEVEVNSKTDNTNIYWFIAITSVAYQQDLFAMDENSIKNMVITKLVHAAEIVEVFTELLDGTYITRKLKIDIEDMDPEELMDKLQFTDEERNWAKVLHGTLEGTGPQREAFSNQINQRSGYNDYRIPGEYLSDEGFAAMIEEGEKYLGYPYVWGGSSPSESFDCSGFVCWVINRSGVGSVGRTTAQGLYNLCSPVPSGEAKPGDLVFFEKTYVTTDRVTHVGIYVGDGVMLHCGNPISYIQIKDSFYESKFYAFGRLPPYE